MPKKSIAIIGMMTGTSCDGLDASCLRFEKSAWKSVWRASTPYPKTLRKRVLDVQVPGAKLKLSELKALDRDLGDWYGSIAKKLIQSRSSADAIANHGQTIGHFPDQGTTVQLGDPTRISAMSGLTVISHFRDGDLAVGGQGAPLLPAYHRVLARQLADGKNGISIHNIGGISNLTAVFSTGRTLAFDTGPGNAWIDAAAELESKGKLKMDRDGKLAARGEIDLPLVQSALRHPYFSRRPPKSTGRDDFSVRAFLELCKKMRIPKSRMTASATAITVESIARAYERWVLKSSPRIEKIFICGGGAQNPTLMDWLQQRLPQIEFGRLEDHGLDPQYIESEGFALFGLMSLLGEPLGGEWTGANHFGPPGQITPGKNWLKLLSKLSAWN